MLGSQSSLGSSDSSIEYVWEPIPDKEPLSKDFSDVQFARKSVDCTEGTCARCESDSFSITTWNPINFKRKTDGKILSFNQLSEDQKALAQMTRCTVKLCLNHILRTQEDEGEGQKKLLN